MAPCIDIVGKCAPLDLPVGYDEFLSKAMRKFGGTCRRRVLLESKANPSPLMDLVLAPAPSREDLHRIDMFLQARATECISDTLNSMEAHFPVMNPHVAEHATAWSDVR
jgi:hypothetical protein